MFDAFWEWLRIGSLAFGDIPDEDEESEEETEEDSDEDEEDEDSEDEDSEEDEEDEDSEDEEEDGDSEEDDKKKKSPLPKTYPEETVKRLRRENKNRRQKQRTAEATIEQQKNEIRDLKRGGTAAKKTKAASSRLEEENEDLRSKLSNAERDRDDLVELQTQTDKVLVIGKIAAEVGFAEASDAVAFLSTRSDDYTDNDGIDEDALKTVLEELLESKPYLAGTQVQETREKEKKGRQEASKRGNPPEKQDIKAQDMKKGQSKSEEVINKEIRQLLDKHDGKGALSVFIAKKYLPKTRKEEVTVR